MIISLDIHQVIGEQELAFEDTFRDVYVGALGESPDARLLRFGWLPHGAGQGYEAVTITAATDIAAWERLVERTRYGDLGEWATKVDAMRYTLHSSIHVTPPWSPLEQLALSDVPTTIDDREPTLLRLDTFAPIDLAQASDHLARAHASADESLLALAASWSGFFGDFDRREMSLLYRVVDDDRLRDALADGDPYATWRGSLLAGSDLDDLPGRTRLLRTARWSPLR